ncbi:MAG: hypothetical protein ACK5CA_12935 [Cyanobacteriota bacterium]
MLKTIEGVYQDGLVRLRELPEDVEERSQVLVMFLDSTQVNCTKLRQLIDQLETIEGIQQGLEQLGAGQTRPIGEFKEEMWQKYGISG